MALGIALFSDTTREVLADRFRTVRPFTIDDDQLVPEEPRHPNDESYHAACGQHSGQPSRAARLPIPGGATRRASHESARAG
jgi:hypothetical protein